MHSLASIISLSLLSSTVSAQTTARVWPHFYPNCPGDAFSKLDTYENYQESAPSQDITINSCKSFAVPSYEHSIVSAISVDAELLSHDHDFPFLEGGSGCNITIHEVPKCIDPPLISKEIRNGVEVSQCENRQFAAYSQVWVNLVCDDDSLIQKDRIPTPSNAQKQHADVEKGVPTNQPDSPVRAEKQTSVDDIKNIQTPGSNTDSWHYTQNTQSQREPVQEGRVNNAGHVESERVVHQLMALLRHKTSKIVSGKQNAIRPSSSALPSNTPTSSNRAVMTPRPSSVLRSRVARFA